MPLTPFNEDGLREALKAQTDPAGEMPRLMAVMMSGDSALIGIQKIRDGVSEMLDDIEDESVHGMIYKQVAEAYRLRLEEAARQAMELYIEYRRLAHGCRCAVCRAHEAPMN